VPPVAQNSHGLISCDAQRAGSNVTRILPLATMSTYADRQQANYAAACAILQHRCVGAKWQRDTAELALRSFAAALAELVKFGVIG
jgi:hypothetical protein